MTDYSKFTDLELTGIFIKEDGGAAFKEIYQRYDKPLYLYAYHKLGSKEEARDVVHDVFAWMLSHRDSFNLQTTLSGYLYRSVLNKIFNIFKHQQILQKYAGEAQLFVDKETTETDYLVREKDILAMIAREIAAMPPKMRQIYEMKSQQYMTAKQIADELGIAESTVITQTKRAMKHLRVKLGLLVYLLYIIKW